MLTDPPLTATPPTTARQPERALTAREAALRKPLPERVSWEELGPEFFRAWGYPHEHWMPEHLAIYGPTGSGKSFFEKTILMERARLRGSHIVLICTKKADKTISSMGWPIVHTWPPSKGWSDRRKTEQVIFWAKGSLSRVDRDRQAAMIDDLLSKLWTEDANIIVVFDEIAYVENELGLSTHIDTYFREGRSQGITVVASTQRPSNVSRFMHSETSWSVFFTPKDEDDAERMAQVAGNKAYYTRVLQQLRRDQYEFLLVHNLTNEAYISSITSSTLGKVSGVVREPDTRVDHSVQ